MEGHSAGLLDMAHRRPWGLDAFVILHDLSLQLSATEEATSVTFKGEIFSVRIFSVFVFFAKMEKISKGSDL